MYTIRLFKVPPWKLSFPDWCQSDDWNHIIKLNPIDSTNIYIGKVIKSNCKKRARMECLLNMLVNITLLLFANSVLFSYFTVLTLYSYASAGNSFIHYNYSTPHTVTDDSLSLETSTGDYGTRLVPLVTSSRLVWVCTHTHNHLSSSPDCVIVFRYLVPL